MSSFQDDLTESLVKASTILRQFIQTIPVDSMQERRGEGCWTVDEHVKHLALVQPMLFSRLDQVKSEDLPAVKPYLPDDNEKAKHKSLNIDGALDEFDSWRRKQVTLLQSFNKKEWNKAITHPDYKLYNTEILVRHILAHDYWHIYRIEELWLVKDVDPF